MVLRRILCSIAALACASGCQTFGGGQTLTLVTTEPEGALVQVEGFGECEAPCTIELDAPRNITVAKAGFTPQRMQLLPGKKTLNIVLELSAPTTVVDEEKLPELR